MLSFKEFDYDSAEYRKSVELRYKVLRKPLSLEFDPEALALENTDHHLGAFLDADDLVACLIMTPLENKLVKMRQFAVEPEYQGKGIGKSLVAFAEEWASKIGFDRIELHARQSAVPFYQKLNYYTKGKMFTEVTLPHWFMSKAL